MKKLLTSLSLAALATLSVGAQQLPNNGFENDWTNMACWAAGSFTNNGTAPSPWKIANVGSPSVAKQIVGSKVAGYNSASAIMVENKSILGKVVPGYFTLGQPWSTAKGIIGGSPDGGTFGGHDFTYRPDAVTFMYKSTGSGQPTVVAYSWTGTYTQASVPSNIVVTGSPKTVNMVDRDRNILGMSTSLGGEVTKTDAALICSATSRLTAAASDWTEGELLLDYKSAEQPQKFNVIFGAEDYFATSPAAENSLTVDDVKLLYFSRLKSLSVDGTAVEGFDSKTYSYDLSSTPLPEESAISYELLSQSGDSKATVSVDKANAQIKITVAQPDAACTDYDGAAQHEYVLQFGAAGEAPVETSVNVFDGIVTILANENLGMDENLDRKGQVTITNYSNNTCTFMLPDFALGDTEEERIGDIVVKNVKTSTDNGTTTYEGVTKGLKLSLGGAEIVANVNLTGTSDANGKAHMEIHVVWLPDPENDPEGEYGIPIEVEFNGQLKGSAISDIEQDNSNSPVEYYNIQGMRVNPDNLTNGIYIRRQGTDVKKVIIR